MSTGNSPAFLTLCSWLPRKGCFIWKSFFPSSVFNFIQLLSKHKLVQKFSTSVQSQEKGSKQMCPAIRIHQSINWRRYGQILFLSNDFATNPMCWSGWPWLNLHSLKWRIHFAEIKPFSSDYSLYFTLPSSIQRPYVSLRSVQELKVSSKSMLKLKESLRHR